MPLKFLTWCDLVVLFFRCTPKNPVSLRELNWLAFSLSQWALSESGKHSLKGQTHSTDLWLNTELCLFTFLLFYTPFERCKYCVRFLYVLINLIFLKGCDLIILSKKNWQPRNDNMVLFKRLLDSGGFYNKEYSWSAWWRDYMGGGIIWEGVKRNDCTFALVGIAMWDQGVSTVWRHYRFTNILLSKVQ